MKQINAPPAAADSGRKPGRKKAIPAAAAHPAAQHSPGAHASRPNIDGNGGHSSKAAAHAGGATERRASTKFMDGESGAKQRTCRMVLRIPGETKSVASHVPSSEAQRRQTINPPITHGSRNPIQTPPTGKVNLGQTPTFSIVIETDNLALVDLGELRICLDSLDRQGDILRKADGIFLADGGAAPESLLRELDARYPWLTVLHSEAQASYVELKLTGTLQTRSEVIVFCDGDVNYEPGWLAALLAGFLKRPEADMIGGETTTPIRGPYSLAFGLSFNFPRLSGETQLAPSTTYWANNVAARRSTLESIPLPNPSELFRGQNLIHTRRILAKSGVILRQPLARAWHAVLPPSVIISRYRQLGRDATTIRTISTRESGSPYLGAMFPDRPDTGVAGRLWGRMGQVARSQPLAFLWLPLALPFLAVMGAAYLFGRLAAGRPPVQPVTHA